MKKVILHACCILISTYAFSQQKEYEIQTLQSKMTLYLNSATAFMGKTRAIVPINLPSNTVSWYYTVSSSFDKTESEVPSLKDQIIKVFAAAKFDYVTVAATLVNAIITVKGNAKCDVQVLDFNSSSDFMAKKTDLGFPNCSLQSVTEAKMEVKLPRTGTYYLGLRNPDFKRGINITVEIVALVKNQQPVRYF